MIQGISNGYYGYQNIGNTSGQMYNARPMFAGQVQPNADTVQFSDQQQPEEESFVSRNLGKIILGGLAVAATAYFTHGKLWGKAAEEAASSAGNVAGKTGEKVGNTANKAGNAIEGATQRTATEAGQAVAEEVKGLFKTTTKEERTELKKAFKAATKGDKEHERAFDYLLNAPGLTLEEAKQAIARNFHLSEELQSVKTINADKPEVTAKIREFLKKEQTITPPKVETPAASTIKDATKVEVPTAEGVAQPKATEVKVTDAPAKPVTQEPATTDEIAAASKKVPTTTDIFTSEVDELEKFTETLGATDRIARNLPKHLQALKDAKTEDERVKALIDFKDLTEKILTDERMTGNCNNRQGLDDRILGFMDKMGMKQINPQRGEAFNVEQNHHILEMVPTDNPALDLKIEGVVEPGYIMNNGRVPRTAKVFCYQYKA